MDIGAVGDLVSAVGLLHNFIIDHRLAEQEEGDVDVDYFASFSHSNLHETDTNNNTRDGLDEVPVAMVTGNEEPRPIGRPPINDRISKEHGRSLRRHIAWSLDCNNMTRPRQQGFKYNSYGMVYME